MQKPTTPIESLQGREDILKIVKSLASLCQIFFNNKIKDKFGHLYFDSENDYWGTCRLFDHFKQGEFDTILFMSIEDLMLEIGKPRPPESLTVLNYVHDRDQAILLWRLQERF